MDEKYIQELYSQLGGQNKFGDFNSFKNLIKNDKNYQKAFHDSFGAKTLGDFNQFSGLVSSSNQKKKDLSQPISQEDQSVSNTQPKPQPTSSDTGQQPNQQASATSNGEPNKKIPFEEWYKTVPKNKNDISTYNLKRAYELAPKKDLDAFVKNPNAHLLTSYPNKDGVYEFMKSKNHPTVEKEIDWYNSKEGADFRSKYKLDTSGDYYRYIPKNKNQQASATSDGEPKIGTFTGFTPEQQKSMQAKLVPDYMVTAKKPSESLNLTDKRLKIQKQIKDLESSKRNSQGTLTREAQNLISQKNKELLDIQGYEKVLQEKNTASIESQIDNVDQTKIDQQMADEFDQNQITDYIREGAKQVAGAIVNPLWKGAVYGRYELPTELIDTKERNVFKDKVNEIKKLDEYKNLSDQDVYNEAVSLVREDFIGAEKNRRADDVLGDLDQAQLMSLKLNGIEKSKSLSAEQKGVITRIKLLDEKHTDIQKNYTGQDKEQKLEEIKQEYLKLVSESNRLGDSLKSNEDKVRMYGMSYSPMENFINLSGSTLIGFAGGGLNLVGSIDETLSSGLNKIGLGFLTGTKPGEKSVFKEMAQPILETEREVSEYTRHITLDDIANSDSPIADTGKYVAQTVSGLIPYALTLGLGAEAQAAEGVVAAAGYNAGKGIIVASSAGKKAHEMEQEMINDPENVKYTTAQRIVAPILYGATDYMMLGGYESMLKGMRGAIQSIEKNDASKAVLDNGIKAFYKSTIGGLKTTASDANKMGAIMAATEATKMFTDENILGKPSTDWSKRIVSSYLDGVAMDLIVKAAPKLGGYLLNKYSTNKYNLEIKNNLKMIEELDKKILNPELTVEDVNILKNSKKEYEDKNIALLDKNIASFKRLTSDQRKEILDIESEKSELREKAKYINSPESKLSVEDKKTQLDGLKSKYVELDNKKSKIIDNKYSALEALDQSEQERLMSDAEVDLTNELNPLREKKITLTEEKIKDRASEIHRLEDGFGGMKFSEIESLKKQAMSELVAEVTPEQKQKGKSITNRDVLLRAIDINNRKFETSKKTELKIPIELKEGEELIDVKDDGKGKTYTYTAKSTEKDGVKTTKFEFNRSDKDPSQRNATGVEADKVLDKYNYEVDPEYIPEGAKVIEINEIRESKDSTGATVTFERDGIKSIGEVVLKPKEAKAEVKPDDLVKEYIDSIEKVKSESPDVFWSVDRPFQNEDGTINEVELKKAAEEGRLIKTEAGFGVVGKDGDIKGVFKADLKSTEKTGDKVIQEAIKAGGTKLDNFALPNLMKIYERNGFREVSRIPFNEEYAPEGWSKEKHGTPDVVAMVYDPEGKLPIEKKNFTDYDEAIKYRDSFLETKQTEPVEVKPTIKSKLEAFKAKHLSKGIDREKLNTQVENAKKSLAKILPGVKFVVHDTKESFVNAAGKNARGFYESGTNTIHINAEIANARTVAHEVFHSLLFNKLKTDANIRELTKKMIDTISKTLDKDSNLKKELDDFIKKYEYDENVKNEEKLSELFGKLAEGYDGFDAPTKSLIKKFIDRVAVMFGLKEFTEGDVVDMLKTLSGKLAAGEEVSEKDVKIIKEQKAVKESVNKFQADFIDPISKVEFVYDKNTGKFNQLEKEGYITKDKSIKDFNGKIIFLHQPDSAFSGLIYKNGELLVEGKGGVYYPIKFHEDGYFWASTDSTAESMAKELNKVYEANNGQILMALTTAPYHKLLSSTTAANGVMEIILSKSFDKNFSLNKEQVKKSLIDAASKTIIKKSLIKDKKTNQPILDKNGNKQYREKSFGLGLKIRKGSTLEEVKFEIQNKLNPKNSSFDDRKIFSEGLISNVADIIKQNPKAVEQFGKFFSEGIKNESFKGVTKTGKLSISAANMTQAISEMLTEPMLKEGVDREKGGQVYAILELNGKVKDIPSKKHESYPKAIQSLDPNNNKVKLHILKDRAQWSDVFEDPTTGDIVTKDRQLNIFPTSGVSIGGLKLNTNKAAGKFQETGDYADMKDIVKDLVDDGKSISEIKKIVGSELGQEQVSLAERAHEELTKAPKIEEVEYNGKKYFKNENGNWVNSDTGNEIKGIGDKGKALINELNKAAEPKEKITSVKNAVVAAEREAQGKAPVEKRETYNAKENFENTKSKVDSGEISPRDLAKSIIDNPKGTPITSEVTDALAYDRMRLSNEYDQVLRNIEKDPTDPSNIIARDRIEQEIEDNDRASRYSGTISSYALLARKNAIKQDYTLDRLVLRYKAATGGKITDEARARLEVMSKKLEEANAKLEEYESKQSEKEAEKALNNIKNEVKRISKEEKRTASKESLKKEREDLYAKLREIRFPKGKFQEVESTELPDNFNSILNKLAKNLVMDGVTELEDVVNDIHNNVKDIFEGVTKRDIRDALSGYGKVKLPSKEEIDVQLREIKSQARLISAYEDAEAGKMPLKTGFQRDTPSDVVRELQRKVQEMMKQNGITRESTGGEKTWKSSLDAIKTRLKNQIRDLEKQIETGEKTPKKTGVAYDAEATALKEQRDALKKIIEDTEGKREISDEQRVKVAISAVEKSIAEYERRIRENDTSPRPKGTKTPETPELKTLRDIRDNLKEEYDQMANPKKTPEEKALKSLKTRLINREKELQNMLDTGNYEKKKRVPTPLDQEAMTLKANVERIKNKVDIEIKKEQLKNRTKYEKTLDFITTWRRNLLLTGVKVLGKLTSAAMQRTIISPIEEITGSVFSVLPGISKISKKAPREGGGFNTKAEVDAISQWWKKATYKDMKEIIKSGRGTLDLLHGKKDDIPGTVLDFFGQLHQALKQPAKRNEYFRSFEKRLTYAKKEGVDISDPMVQATIGAQAYLDANRAIFMQDNLVTDAYKSFVSSLERGGNLGKTGAAVTKIILPIVKVPTNFVGEVTSYSGGYLKVIPLVTKAIFKGIDSLSPEQADYVMRNIKKGSLGAAFIAIGYFNASSIGGYYQRGEKREEDDVKAANLRVLGVDMPKWMIHTPLLEALQVGATLRRVQDSYENKGKEEGVAASGLAVTKGLVEEVPFARSPEEALRALGGTKQAKEYVRNLGESMINPQLTKEMGLEILPKEEKEEEGTPSGISL